MGTPVIESPMAPAGFPYSGARITSKKYVFDAVPDLAVRFEMV